MTVLFDQKKSLPSSFPDYFWSFSFSSKKKYQIHLNLVPTYGSEPNLVPPLSSARFTFKTPFSSPIPLQMSSSSSKNNSDDSDISIVADSPSCNTRAASSAGWPGWPKKKHAPLPKTKTNSKQGTSLAQSLDNDR
jgi:hypothetical protein